LFLELKPRNAFERLLAGLVVKTAEAAHDCFAETTKSGPDLKRLNANAKCATKFADASASLSDILERRQSRSLALRAGADMQVGHIEGLGQELADRESVKLYYEFAPRNKLESVLISLLISANNAAITLLNRAMNAKSNCAARELNLRYALLSINTVLHLLVCL
jgi:hypothetical protein